MRGKSQEAYYNLGRVFHQVGELKVFCCIRCTFSPRSQSFVRLELFKCKFSVRDQKYVIEPECNHTIGYLEINKVYKYISI